MSLPFHFCINVKPSRTLYIPNLKDYLRKTMIKKLFNELIAATSQKLVVNLSSSPLPDLFVSLLSKSLRFVPTPNPVRWQTLLKSILRLIIIFLVNLQPLGILPYLIIITSLLIFPLFLFSQVFIQ